MSSFFVVIFIFEYFITFFCNFNYLIYVLFNLKDLLLDKLRFSLRKFICLDECFNFLFKLILLFFLIFKIMSILFDLFKKLTVIFIAIMNKFIFKFLFLFKILDIPFKNKFLLFKKTHLGLVHVLFFFYCCLDFICFHNVILYSSHFFFASKYFSFFLL